MSTVEGWERSILSDQLELIRNGYSGKQVGQVTSFPVSRIETISNGMIDQSKVGYVNFIPDSYLLKPGDILFSNINSLKHIGKVAQVSDEIRLFHGMNLLVLRPVKQVDKKFLFYKLVNAKTWFEKMAAQAINQASINQGTLQNLQLELPKEKREQTKIAEILSTIDQAIEQTKALIAKQQRTKTGLMQGLLTRGIDEDGNLRSEETHKFKDSPLGRIPVDWTVKQLSNVVDLKVGYAFKSSWFSEDGIRLVRGENVGVGIPDWKDTQYLPFEIAHKFEEYQLNAGDIIIGMDRTFTKQGFKVSLLSEEDTPCLLVQRVGCFVPLSIPRIFMQLLIQSSTYQRELLLQQKGMDIPHLSKSEILAPLVPIPADLDEMNAISNIIETIQSIERNYIHNLNKLRSLKTGLMQDLLTGKKRVTVLLKEKEIAGV